MRKLLQTLSSSIANTLKGHDGNISSRKVTAFWFVALATVIILCLLVMIWLALFRQMPLTDYTIRLVGLAIDMLMISCCMILLLFGVITWQQVQGFKFLGPGKKKKDEESN